MRKLGKKALYLLSMHHNRPVTSNVNRSSSKILITAALASAALVGTLAVSADSFWIDEGWTAHTAIQPTFSAWWSSLLWEHSHNEQLPLYHVLLWIWQKIVGSGEWALRVLNVPFLLVTVYAFYVVFRRDRQTFVFSTAFLLGSAFVWFYLNQARPYLLLLSASALLFSAVQRSWHRENGWNSGWAWLLAGSALITAATSMTAVLWVMSSIFAIWYVEGRRFPLTYASKAPAACGTLIAGMLVIGSYYVWTIKSGAAGTLATPGILSLALAAYEFLGFAGLGPPRNEMRASLFHAFNGYQLVLGAFALVWVAAIAYTVLLDRRRFFACQRVVFYGILVLPIPVMLLLAYVERHQLLARHLTPSLPLVILLTAYLANRLWDVGFLGRALIVGLLGFSAASCLELRFARRHLRDDYRSAARLVKSEVSHGNRVFWAADTQTAIYYGVIPEVERDGPGTLVLHGYGGGAERTAAARCSVIVLSKPDLYDQSGIITDLLHTGPYRLEQTYEAFEIWRRHGPTTLERDSTQTGLRSSAARRVPDTLEPDQQDRALWSWRAGPGNSRQRSGALGVFGYCGRCPAEFAPAKLKPPKYRRDDASRVARAAKGLRMRMDRNSRSFLSGPAYE